MAYKDKKRDIKYRNEWQRANKDRIVVLLNKDEGARVRAAAAESGVSISRWIANAILDKLGR